MNKVNAAVAVLAIAASFAATDSFSQGNAPGRPDVNVNVTNTPLPVTLTNPVTTVTIANPVTSSTVTVNNPASSPIPVTIANVPAAPIVVQLADPGTTPYQHTQSFNPGAANCTQNNLNCTTTFPAVPAGKRLVIQHASADFALTPGGTFPRASLRSPNSGVTLALPVPIRTGLDSYVVSTPVTFYVEAGASPVLAVSGQFVSENNTATATVVGYLINVP